MEKKPPSYVRNSETGEVRILPREKLLQRLPATAAAAEALEEIQGKLAIATEFFDHHGDGGSLGVYRAILDVVDYFVSQGIPRATLAPLAQVAAAIVDAGRGAESPIFRPERLPKNGAPPTTISQLEFEGHLATITECCVRHCKAQGMRPYLGPACDMAATLVNKSKWPVKVTDIQMQNLRERASQAKSGSMYRLQMDIAMKSEVAQTRPLEWAKLLLTHDWVGPPPAQNSC